MTWFFHHHHPSSSSIVVTTTTTTAIFWCPIRNSYRYVHRQTSKHFNWQRNIYAPIYKPALQRMNKKSSTDFSGNFSCCFLIKVSTKKTVLLKKGRCLFLSKSQDRCAYLHSFQEVILPHQGYSNNGPVLFALKTCSHSGPQSPSTWVLCQHFWGLQNTDRCSMENRSLVQTELTIPWDFLCLQLHSKFLIASHICPEIWAQSLLEFQNADVSGQHKLWGVIKD